MVLLLRVTAFNMPRSRLLAALFPVFKGRGNSCRGLRRKAFRKSSLLRSRTGGNEVGQAPAGRPSGLPAAAAVKAASTTGWTRWSHLQTQPSCRHTLERSDT